MTDEIHETLAARWGALRDALACHASSLCDEVARYPTPIARCDAQLPALIDDRRRAIAMLQRAEAIGPPPCPPVAFDAWCGAVAALLDEAGAAMSDGASRACVAAVRDAIRATGGAGIASLIR